jgi:hypothetical protein
LDSADRVGTGSREYCGQLSAAEFSWTGYRNVDQPALTAVVREPGSLIVRTRRNNNAATPAADISDPAAATASQALALRLDTDLPKTTIGGP